MTLSLVLLLVGTLRHQRQCPVLHPPAAPPTVLLHPPAAPPTVLPHPPAAPPTFLHSPAAPPTVLHSPIAPLDPSATDLSLIYIVAGAGAGLALLVVLACECIQRGLTRVGLPTTTPRGDTPHATRSIAVPRPAADQSLGPGVAAAYPNRDATQQRTRSVATKPPKIQPASAQNKTLATVAPTGSLAHPTAERLGTTRNSNVQSKLITIAGMSISMPTLVGGDVVSHTPEWVRHTLHPLSSISTTTASA